MCYQLQLYLVNNKIEKADSIVENFSNQAVSKKPVLIAQK
jgi:hypothetical protein